MTILHDLEFVVVGSGRSGTRYASALFDALHIPCGHEAVFSAHQPSARRLIGDASFGVVPYLDEFKGVVLHQVRHPLSVLASMLATNFFDRPENYDPYYRLITSVIPTIDRLDSQMLKAMHFIVVWNKLCEDEAVLRWRLEDLTAETICRATEVVGHKRTLADCRDAIAIVPRGINRLEQHGIRRIELDWGDLPDCNEKTNLAELASRYGYEVFD